MNQDRIEKITNEDEISIKDLINKLKSLIGYLKRKWLIIFIVSIIGLAAGLCYSITNKVTYKAICTFVLDEGSKSGGLSQFGGLASLAGVDIGGGGGIFQGDNILELYKSRLMIEKALLSEIEINGKKQLLIDRYIETNQLRDKWKKQNIGNVSFNGNPDKFSRVQDSIITNLTQAFNVKLLSVDKPDKKTGIINVQMLSTDELFAKEFTNKLVETVNDFYVRTKTKKTLQNVIILQHQVDSVKSVLNSSISGVASSVDAVPNANPNMVSLRVPSQKRQVDVQASSAIYAEMAKNLELSKITLRQETPLIQVVDKPILPLDTQHVGKLKGMALGAILGFVFIVIGLLGIKIYKNVVE